MARIVVLGAPHTQGSKNAFVNRKTGRAVVVDVNPKGLAGWRRAVRDEAQRWAEAHERACYEGPVVVTMHFALAKPASAPKTRRVWPVGARSGDGDKLARSVLDSLTGVLFADDSQVVGLLVVKDYGFPVGVTIDIAAARDSIIGLKVPPAPGAALAPQPQEVSDVQ